MMGFSVNSVHNGGELQENAVNLKVGSFIHGQVIKLKAEQTADVRLAGTLHTAKLELPLKSGESYLFQVTQTQPELRLRIAADSRTAHAAAASLPDTREMAALLKMAVNQQVSFSHEQLSNAEKLMKISAADVERSAAALLHMARNKLPMNEGIFKSVLAGQAKEPLLGDLIRLESMLSGEKNQQVVTDLLKSIRNIRLPLETVLLAEGKEQQASPAESGNSARSASSPLLAGPVAAEMIKSILASVGGDYEAELLSDRYSIQEGLKSQLILLLQNSAISPQLREQAETILLKLNGAQLLSSEHGQQVQLLMQLPFEFSGRRIDAHIEWNGRRKRDGSLDADHARIVFYLSLAFLKQTVIDMKVQDRIVSLTIYHDQPGLEQLIRPLVPALGEGLGQTGYKLSQVLVKPVSAQPAEQSGSFAQIMQEGIDMRI